MIRTLVHILVVTGIFCLASQSATGADEAAAAEYEAATAAYETATAAYNRNDYSAAYKQLLPLARHGDAKSQAVIAMMYKYGESVAVNYAEAFNWYLASAKQDYPPAQYSLAELYEKGKGTPADPEQALYWYTKAAQAGLTRAKERLKTNDLEKMSHQAESWSRDWNFNLPTSAGTSPEQPASKPAPDSTSYRIQLGAMKSTASAQRLWMQIYQPNQDLFSGFQPFFNSHQVSKSSLVRIQVGTFATLERARHFCNLVQARGIKSGCLTTRSRPELDMPL